MEGEIPTTLGGLLEWAWVVAFPALQQLFSRLRRLETDMALKADKEKVQTQLDAHIQRVEDKLDKLTNLLIQEIQMKGGHSPRRPPDIGL